MERVASGSVLEDRYVHEEDELPYFEEKQPILRCARKDASQLSQAWKSCS